MTNATIPDTIERELVLPYPIERVWTAITDPAELAKWFGDSAEVDLRPGGAAMFGWSQYNARGPAVVETVDPPRRFAFWWISGQGDTVEPHNRTLVDFTLEPADGGTRLRLVESGFAALADGETKRSDNSEGWTMELGELEAYLRGDAVA
jgi:uncharacterized protein YndB with AHSA1/START domain